MAPILYQLMQNYLAYAQKSAELAYGYANKLLQFYSNHPDQQPFDARLTDGWQIALALIIPIVISSLALYLDRDTKNKFGDKKNDDDVFYF
ncbi:MAG: hypothetical protein N3D75_02380 [Candidatus Aenigmarchaeota archaeon]|nr:hypothetical protein [Candidatus Aenigmarchaeota archaeon]